ncbi:polysialyltransferase family glycosyltransferase [Thermaerobacter sp. PB12/4term]|uniref:polysialyltransferase family glycosyltransferase n=1 Tax=Thermaerobacter sp. PB12/4term TaxID=2293838 RepID=UPI0026ADCA36
MVGNKVHNVFLSMTPYHLLLSYGIAMTECRRSRNWLIVVADFSNVDAYLKIMQRSDYRAFERVMIYNGMFGIESKYARRLRVLRNVRSIRELVRSVQIERVFIANDIRPEGQALIHFAKTAWGANCVYIEDGAAVYSSLVLPARSKIVSWLASLFCRAWWEDVRVHGTSRAIDEVRAIYPHALRPELHRVPVKKIDSSLISRINIDRCEVNASLLRDGKAIEVDNIDAIMLLPHSQTVAKGRWLVEAVSNVLLWAQRERLVLGVKYHPREPHQYLNSLLENLNDRVVVISQELPIEWVYALRPKRLRYVFGDWSTGLLTARWLLPNVAVFRTDTWVYEDEGLLRTFEGLGIRPFSSLLR